MWELFHPPPRTPHLKSMPATSELLQKGRYRFDSSTLDQGPSHAVQAYDTTSDKMVYVKEIAVRLGKVTTLSQQENMRQNFEDAARRLAEFRHDSLLQVKDYYLDVGRQYLVLESVEGDDFQTLMDKNKRPFAVEDVLDWADQLLDVVNYLHNQTPIILHKSICPRNLELVPTGKIKLLGINVPDASGNILSTSLSEPESGILNYSPLELIWDGLDAASQKVIVNSYDERSEKILKEAPDVRSDIYSIGATIYLLLTAKMPIDPLERSIELLEGNADPLKGPNVLDTRIAPEISDVIMRALEIKRENRYDSATIMRQVLRTAVVRVKEREAAEAQELEEAAEFLRGTQKLQMPISAQEPQSAGPSEAEILTRKLREAEEMRLEAEGRAAEAERLLKEREAEQAPNPTRQGSGRIETVTAAPVLVNHGDDLLHLIESTSPAAHVSDPASNSSTAEPDDDIHLSVKPEPRAKIDLKMMARAQIQPHTETHVSVSAEKPVSEIEPAGAEETSEIIEEPDPYLFDEVESKVAAQFPEQRVNYDVDSVPEFVTSRSGLPIPIFAGLGALVLIVAVAGYVFIGGSDKEPVTDQSSAPTQNIAAPLNEPQPPQATSTAEIPVSQQPEDSVTQRPADTQTEVVVTSEPGTAPKSVQTPKAAKPATQSAKTPAPKRPVTADDLINDN